LHVLEGVEQIVGICDGLDLSVVYQADFPTLFGYYNDQRVASLGESNRRPVTGAVEPRKITSLGQWQNRAYSGDVIAFHDGGAVVNGGYLSKYCLQDLP
jgi:hypothetical protein